MLIAFSGVAKGNYIDYNKTIVSAINRIRWRENEHGNEMLPGPCHIATFGL